MTLRLEDKQESRVWVRGQICGCLGVFLLAWVGCSVESMPPSTAESPDDERPAMEARQRSEPERRATAEGHTFVTVDETTYEARLREFAGKVVLVDFWALWCPNCLEQFPETVRLDARFRDRGLQVIGLNFDSLEDPQQEERARDFLTEVGADFPQWTSRYGPTVKSMDAFELPASLPHYRLYDRSGGLVASWDGQPDDLASAVEQALRNSESP